MRAKAQIKTTGATFTPRELSIFLAERIAAYTTDSDSLTKILDPACGEGELLLAMGEAFSELNKDYTLAGYDADAQYLNIAKERISRFNNVELKHGDFLEAIEVDQKQKTLDFIPNTKQTVNKKFDIVIANPPYVRTQILGAEQAQSLAKKFNLKGRVDLYYPFLIAMTESLKEGGILGVITSNRYLSTKSGESIRHFLSENYQILELIDLGDTKLFDAAVLPAIFIGKKLKTKIPSQATFTKIYQELNGYSGSLIPSESIYEILRNKKSGYFIADNRRYKKTSGKLKYTVASTSSWEMFSDNEADWVSKIDNASQNKIGQLFKVKVGIKSTADKVFISDNWEELGNEMPEEVLLKELISQENIEPWGIKEKFNLKVLYPHIISDNKKTTIDISKFPKAKGYFLRHEEKLKARKYLMDAGRQWFELWVPHNPEQWKYPKLVFPDISLKPRFYFDKGGKIVNGNCYWIVADKKEDIDKLLLIQGVANSKLMTKYHDLVFNNKLYSGRRRYFTQYVEKYPLPDVHSTLSKEIIDIVKQLNKSRKVGEILELETLLEIKVAEAFNVAPVFTVD